MKPEQSTIHIISANLARWLGPGLPDPVVDAAREHLRGSDIPARLRGAWLSFDAQGEIRSIRDVFRDPAYDEARERAYRMNKAIWDAHGGNFSPVGVGASKVEKSYPLAKMIARITAQGSPYVSKRRKEGVRELTAAPK